MDLSDAELKQRAAADRREVGVHRSRWTPPPGRKLQLDWRVKERREWWRRVRGADGRQRWIRAMTCRCQWSLIAGPLFGIWARATAVLIPLHLTRHLPLVLSRMRLPLLLRLLLIQWNLTVPSPRTVRVLSGPTSRTTGHDREMHSTLGRQAGSGKCSTSR